MAYRPRWRFLARTLSVVAVVVVIAGAFIWVAESHYARGKKALETQDYSMAAAEFAAAKVLVFPYRDAGTLERQARDDFSAVMARERDQRAQEAAVAAQVEKVRRRLVDGDPAGALKALQAVAPADLKDVLSRSQMVAGEVDGLTADLLAAAQKSLGDLAWARAGSYAAAVLVLRPSSTAAAALVDKAAAGKRLSQKLGEARAAARHGQWRRALRLALAVVAEKKDFPGAAAVVADARRALAPKPSAAAGTSSGPATAGSSSGSGSGSTGSGSSGSANSSGSSGSSGSSQPPPP